MKRSPIQFSLLDTQVRVRVSRVKKTRNYALISQKHSYYRWLFRQIFSKRMSCLLGALYLVLQQPVAIAHATTHKLVVPVRPVIMRPVSPIQPLQAPIPPEQPLVPMPAPKVCQSGVQTGNYYEDLVINRESGGNSCIYNSIGACGLFQALPCSKLGCDLTDITCQLNWGYNYMINNYGSWAAAWNHEVTAGWW